MILKENLNLRVTVPFFVGWFVVTILGYGFAGLMFHFPSGFPPNNGDQMNVPGFAFGIFMGALSGLVIGGLQALVLRCISKRCDGGLRRTWEQLQSFTLSGTGCRMPRDC